MRQTQKTSHYNVQPKNYGRPIKRIVIHCTATTQKATVDSILNYFRNVKKWRNPGYHYIIAPDGTINLTHPLSKIANGVRGYNHSSVHIAYIGGKKFDDRTPEQKKSMKFLLKKLLKDNELGDIPVMGHRDLSPDLDGDGAIEPHEFVKLCPNFDVKKWMIEEKI